MIAEPHRLADKSGSLGSPATHPRPYTPAVRATGCNPLGVIYPAVPLHPSRRSNPCKVPPVQRILAATDASSRCVMHQPSQIHLPIEVRLSGQHRQHDSRNATWCHPRQSGVDRWCVTDGTTATECASTGSVLRPWPVANTRARAGSFDGTSITVSPSATRRWAISRPMPLQPSTRQTRSLCCRPSLSIATPLSELVTRHARTPQEPKIFYDDCP